VERRGGGGVPPPSAPIVVAVLRLRALAFLGDGLVELEALRLGLRMQQTVRFSNWFD
jgi:hypothetical protein